MNIAMIGNIGQYTKTMKMTMDWEQKKISGNYTKKADKETSEIDLLEKQMEEMRQNAADNKDAIYTKLRSGKKLTAEEMDYLRENDPEAYKQAKEVEMERKHYEEELKRCKTKEEAERFRINYLSNKAAVAMAVANNPNIPEGKKMAILLHENAKLQAVQEVDIQFKRSSQYANLPTEEERAEEIARGQEELRGEPEQAEAEEKKEVEEIQDLKPEESVEQAKSGEDGEEGAISERSTGTRTETAKKKNPVRTRKAAETRRIDLGHTVEISKPEISYVHQMYKNETNWEAERKEPLHTRR